MELRSRGSRLTANDTLEGTMRGLSSCPPTWTIFSDRDATSRCSPGDKSNRGDLRGDAPPLATPAACTTHGGSAGRGQKKTTIGSCNVISTGLLLSMARPHIYELFLYYYKQTSYCLIEIPQKETLKYDNPDRRPECKLQGSQVGRTMSASPWRQDGVERTKMSSGWQHALSWCRRPRLHRYLPSLFRLSNDHVVRFFEREYRYSPSSTSPHRSTSMPVRTGARGDHEGEEDDDDIGKRGSIDARPPRTRWDQYEQ